MFFIKIICEEREYKSRRQVIEPRFVVMHCQSLEGPVVAERGRQAGMPGAWEPRKGTSEPVTAALRVYTWVVTYAKRWQGTGPKAYFSSSFTLI